jgi:acetoin utilization protein AcuB
MLVKDFMQKDVAVVSSHDSIYDALKIFKDKNIRRMPVIDNGKLVGIVTRKALREASPSKATTLSVHELNYLLSKMIIADVMKKKVVTISQDTPIEEAGLRMHKNQIGGLPVMENDEMVGFISSNDMFSAIVKINGLDKPVARISLEVPLENWQKTVAKCTEILDEAGCEFKMMSLMKTEDPSKKLMIFRFKEAGDIQNIVEKIKANDLNVISVIQNVQLV